MENLNDIVKRAEAGDAAAQYQMAAHCDREGRKAEAARWLEAALAAGHPAALYTCATEMLSGPPHEMRIDEAVVMLERAAASGGAAAARQLAVLAGLGLGVRRDWAAAVARLAVAAKSGHPAAMRELAVLASTSGAPRHASDGLLADAARKGDWIAAYLALRRGGIFGNIEHAAMRSRLMKGGAPRAAMLPVEASPNNPISAIDIDGLAAAAMKFSASSGAIKSVAHERPEIARYVGGFTQEECDYIVCSAAPLLTRSLVVNSETSTADHAEFRTSDGAMFGLLDLDLALFALYARLADFAGAPHENCELMGVLRYAPGQEYRAHYDFLPTDAEDYSEVKRSGQRARTALIALTEEFTGGETVFPKLNLAFRGKTGDVLVFHNTDASGAPYRETLHAGAPVLSGEKWLLTLWCRERPFWFWA